MHIIQKTLPTCEYDYTDKVETQFRPVPEVVVYDTYFVDPQYGLDPHWGEELYDQDKLEYKHTYNKPKDQIEIDDLITDAHVSDALRYALIDLWTVNPRLPDASALPNFQPRLQNQQTYGPKKQFSGTSLHTEEENAFFHIDSGTNKTHSTNQSYLSQAPFE